MTSWLDDIRKRLEAAEARGEWMSAPTDLARLLRVAEAAREYLRINGGALGCMCVIGPSHWHECRCGAGALRAALADEPGGGR